MRAPRFWGPDGNGIRSTLLAPLACLYAQGTRVRMALTQPWRAPVPVLCIGNLVAGGAGKTPVALSIAARFVKHGLAVHFLTRGYGGQATGPLRVDTEHHTAAIVGDEALLLARIAPTWVARDRVAGARAAADADAGVLIMDDGFQNPSLAKDISLVVADGTYGFGNRRVIPAGPLREPIAQGLARARAVVIIGPDNAGVAQMASHRPDLPILEADIIPLLESGPLAGKRILAFAGIGTPEKFFRTLTAAGANLVATRAFPDHHVYDKTDIATLRQAAADTDAVPMTTEKDYMRLSVEQRQGIEVLAVTVQWRNDAALDAILEPVIAHGRA